MARILVIEDDELLGMAITTVLGEKYEVNLSAEAPSPEEISTNRPDLLLLDFNAPDGGAASFVDKLREAPGLQDVRVVLMSGNHDAMKSSPSLATHCAGFLRKPFTLDLLSNTVEKLLAQP